MKLLKEKGYSKYRPPQTRTADQLYQRRVEVESTEQDMYLNAYVFEPLDYPEHPSQKTVEFEFQLDRENEKSIRVKLFSFNADELNERTLENVEDKTRNLFIYSHYA